jgi:hypothetical protein
MESTHLSLLCTRFPVDASNHPPPAPFPTRTHASHVDTVVIWGPAARDVANLQHATRAGVGRCTGHSRMLHIRAAHHSLDDELATIQSRLLDVGLAPRRVQTERPAGHVGTALWQHGAIRSHIATPRSSDKETKIARTEFSDSQAHPSATSVGHLRRPPSPSTSVGSRQRPAGHAAVALGPGARQLRADSGGRGYYRAL